MNENNDPKTPDNRVVEVSLRDGRLKIHADIPAGPDGRIKIDADMSADHFGAMSSSMGNAIATMAPAFIRPAPCGDCDPFDPDPEGEERPDPSPDCADPPPPPPGVSYPPPPPQVVR